MGFGISGGILWALDTVILGIALTLTPFVSSEQAIFLAPFVSTFLHDAFSSVWMLLYTGVTRQFANVWRALKTRSGKFIMLGALLGGPVGMSGYVAAIHFIGPGMTAVISSMYPALGALLSYFFLKEKMKPAQIIGLLLSIGGLMSVGFEKAWLMQTAGNITSSEIISTYVYKVTIAAEIPQYSFGTAVDLFNSVINITLLVLANVLAKKFGQESLW